jgi:thioredoxin reductase
MKNPEALIVGSGTTGLTMAIELRRAGMNVRITNGVPPHARTSITQPFCLKPKAGWIVPAYLRHPGHTLDKVGLFSR